MFSEKFHKLHEKEGASLGDILNTGLVLLVLGMSVVFLVLLFLMYIMEIMSKIVTASLRAKPKSSAEGSADEEELAVIISVMNTVNPGIDMANIRLKLIR
jgi:sodium pump decarboxylase gamma subunit